MRHKKLNKRFGRNKSQRKQLMRSLARGLFLYYKIETTAEKAKQLRRLAERLISLGKKAALADIRAIDRVLQDRALTRKLIQNISPLFKNRNGGYTRVIRTGYRKGDGAPLAVLELVEKPAVEKKPKKIKKEKKLTPPAEKKLKPPKVEGPAEAIPEEKKPEEKKKPKEELPSKKGLLEKFKRFFKGLLERFKGFFKK